MSTGGHDSGASPVMADNENATLGDSTTTGAREPNSSLPPIGPAQRIGRYWLLEPLGRGGMGVVYLGYDSELHRKVAVKLLHDEASATASAPRRLLREAQALAQVSHPNLVQVYDVGTVDGRVFMAMELVAGRTVAQWFKQDPTWREVLAVFVAAGRGLAAAHAAGIVHRDFKPGNVVVGEQGSVRVLDFGLARVRLDAPDPDARASGPSSQAHSLPPGLSAELADARDEPLTVGALLGTPAYMAPEQHAGGVATPQSDQYSFCLALYQGLYGERPFPNVPLAQLGRLKREGRWSEPRAGGRAPAWLRRVVLRGLSPASADRYPSMDALLDQLHVTPRAAKWRWALSIGALGVVGLSAWAIGRRDGVPGAQCDEPDAAWIAVWSPARAAGIARAFEATGLRYAPDTWQRLRPVVDHYAAQWVAMRGEACRATHVAGTQSGTLLDLRIACLDRRRDELDAVLALYESPDAAFVARAADAVGGLSSLAPCADVDGLMHGVSRPASAEGRAALVKAQRWLAEAEALDAAGKHSAAEARALAALAEGERIAYRPLIAEAKLALAEALDNDPVRAEAAAREAVDIAAAVGDDGVFRTALRRLMFAVGVRRGRVQEAQGLAAATRAAWLRAGLDPEHDATLQSDFGLLAAAQGHATEARDHFARSLSALDAEQASMARRLVVVGGYAAALMQQGAWAEAEAALVEAGRLGRETYGPHHPFVADVELNLGQIASQIGDAPTANAHFEAALKIWEADPAQHRERLALTYTTYASVALIEGRPAIARQRATRALAQLDSVEASAPLAAVAFDVLGTAASFDGDDATAITDHRRALSLATAGFGPGSANEALARAHLADSLAMGGQWSDARLEFDAAKGTLDAVFGTEGGHHAELQLTESVLLLAEGDAAAAGVAAEQALRLLPEGQHVPIARAHVALSQALLAQGERQRAVEHADAARTSFAALVLLESVARLDAWRAAHAL